MVIRVKIGGLEAAKSPEVLETLLGSCVALMLYDRGKRIGGMAHIMLPYTDNTKIRTPGKYANTAVPALITKLTILGARPNKLIAKIAGGSAMFKGSETMNIGKKNIESTKKELSKYNIRVVKEDTGGEGSRTVKFYLKDGKVEIFHKGGTKII
ncbi:MAG TPA: chemotaxis protein CheD [Methanothermococcus okinawensis]|uniref:Probable chemoreceptor glutamine deamidase CheD n=1 Tax=Methanothermococcus okinawensis TaxID=155863 RepID=A0A832YRN4_9EURY|nr:chemotaxis protein CheD [Methanothermococcus okinawensis]